jgi:transposase-like protein
MLSKGEARAQTEVHEFKESAAKLVSEQGYTVAEAADKHEPLIVARRARNKGDGSEWHSLKT